MQQTLTHTNTQDEITDRFNAFIIEVDVQAPELQLQPGDGNETPEDFSGFPIVSNAGTTVIQVQEYTVPSSSSFYNTVCSKSHV